MQKHRVAGVEILKRSESGELRKTDLLAVEEPLELRLEFGDAQHREEKSLAVTMRTPGHDLELALGFLFTEGFIKSADQVRQIFHCEQVKSEEERGNVVKICLQPDVTVNLANTERNFYTSSSCGVCGKESIEALSFYCKKIDSPLKIAENILFAAPEKMRAAQDVFEHTGGLHAAALFDQTGELKLLREDIGRHNALDKLIGAALAEDMIPLHEYYVVVSGRVGFELVQKSTAAGIPLLAAVGAPSSLAVKLADEYNMTLVGFLRDKKYNIYTGEHRIELNQQKKLSDENTY
ncbi:formate dehydrogenase accessory sulfurtransferase FdhD [Fulvivirga sp. RKSG066]|uniref:formate dehydrogenase accessory sulfurtransferase FdhD n=1 Tax=Fulvivirga aurantia TaxID=2529383 RepID=UPI0012BBA0FC|nr:formate dehydrogenase accessory sulfurtransferase FdhD [Fulvivirga aurantia]MTI22342.1 formate dehydrogenase accessory sulfurtransferase FdhD [Fulvivirga aurantia]